MSFFQRMMKINQLNNKNSLKEIQSIYNQEQTAPNRQDQLINHFGSKPNKKNSSLKSSIAIKLEQEQQENGWEQLAQEPKIEPLYTSKMPIFLHHLLPKREQLMREMLSKKQLQLKKKILCQQKKMQLQIKIEQDSLKFKNSLIKPPKKTSIKQSVKINEMTQSRVSEKLSNTQMRKYSMKNISGDKQSKGLVLGQSTYSMNVNPQGLASPVSQAFNREIMLKLLNIIEKDRQNVALKSNVFVSDKKQKERDAPIIINNIMKTPHENINKDLIDRELKIKMLQNTRLERQKGSICKPNQTGTGYKSFFRGQVSNQERVLTQRTNLANKIQTPEFQASIRAQNLKSQKKNSHPSQDKPLLKQKSECKQNLGIKLSGRKIETQTQKNLQDSSTKFNSRDSKLKKEEEQSREKREVKQNKRQFQKVRIQKQDQNSIKVKNTKQIQKSQRQKTQVVKDQPQQEYKPPVRLDIPLQNKSQMQGLTLAQAFKRKIGRLKSQQKLEKTTKIKEKLQKNISPFQQIPTQMNITLTDKLTSYQSRMDLQKSPNMNSAVEDLPSKRTVTSKNLSKQTSIKKQSTQERSSSKIKQPSVQLVNRLIYGTKAKVTKQEMYALTRKNYANLPEVQAKKKDQEKRKAEQQRLAKAKEYQKAIRKSSTKI